MSRHTEKRDVSIGSSTKSEKKSRELAWLVRAKLNSTSSLGNKHKKEGIECDFDCDVMQCDISCCVIVVSC